METIDLRSDLPWNANGKKWATRDLGDITHLVVHHSATGENQVPLRTVQAFNRGHIQRNDWPRIAYHYVISRDGTVFWVNRNRDITTHAGNWNVNKHSIGVCLIGKLHINYPTQAQLDSLKALRLHISSNRGKDLPAIPHYQVVDTSCPGKHWWPKEEPYINSKLEPIGPAHFTDHSLLTLHNQLGLPPWLKRFVEQSGTGWMKMMDPGDARPMPECPDLNWVIRFMESEATAAAEVLHGAQGALERLHRVAPELRKRPWLADAHFYLEHMNEPTNAGLLRTDRSRKLLDIFTAEYTRLLWEEFGIRSCGYCLGVGHPEPEHVGQLFTAGLAALKRYNGIWALHEYGWPTVLTLDEAGLVTNHHSLRWQRTLAALQLVGWKLKDLPKLHITEAGIDKLLIGVIGGWQTVNNDPRWYIPQLADYDRICRTSPVIEAIYVFTATAEGTWRSYEIREGDADLLAHYIKTGEIRS